MTATIVDPIIWLRDEEGAIEAQLPKLRQRAVAERALLSAKLDAKPFANAVKDLVASEKRLAEVKAELAEHGENAAFLEAYREYVQCRANYRRLLNAWQAATHAFRNSTAYDYEVLWRVIESWRSDWNGSHFAGNYGRLSPEERVRVDAYLAAEKAEKEARVAACEEAIRRDAFLARFPALGDIPEPD